MSRFLEAAVVLLALAGVSQAEPLGLGRPAAPDEIAAWDIDIRPDGAGLPDGRGDVATGEEVFTEHCVACHGDFGEGVGRFPPLAGGAGTLTHERPVKTVGSYWPHLSTVLDYVRRAQPFGSPGRLTDDEVYALTAYILYLNDLVDDDFVLDRDSFGGIEMPNAAGFVGDTRPEEPAATVCMADCKAAPDIERRATDLGIE